MKQKAIIFIIGLLTGAVISTGAIFIYTLAESNNQTTTMPQMGGEQGGQNTQGGQIDPGAQNQTQNGNTNTPPEKPADNNQTQAN